MNRDECTATQPKTTPDLYFQARNETRKQTSTSPLVSASRGGGEKTKPAIGQGPGVGELLTKRLVVDRERAHFPRESVWGSMIMLSRVLDVPRNIIQTSIFALGNQNLVEGYASHNNVTAEESPCGN